MQLAVDQFQLALKQEPDNLPARNNLALALAALGSEQEARLHIEAVLKKRPNDGNAHVNLDVILEN